MPAKLQRRLSVFLALVALIGLALLTEQLGSQQAALGKLSQIVHQHAAIMAYNDAFHFVGLALGISMLAVFLTRALPPGTTGGAAH